MLIAKNLRFYSRFSRSASKKRIDIVRVEKQLYPEAVAFMRSNFLDDPLLRAMRISMRHKEIQHFLSKLWLTLLKSGFSLAAIHRKRLCGLCINCPRFHQGPHLQPDNDVFLELASQTKTKNTRNLLLAWDKIDRETFFPTTGENVKTLELAFCTVDQYYRRLGIARKMIQSSADMAMLLGFDFVRIDCTHMATAKICNQLGWELISQMPFKMFNGVTEDFFPANDNPVVQVYVKNIKVNLPDL